MGLKAGKRQLKRKLMIMEHRSEEKFGLNLTHKQEEYMIQPMKEASMED